MKSDVMLQNELANFLAQATANADELGVEPAEIELLTDNIAAFEAGMSSVVATKAAAKAAVSAKNEAAATLRAQIASFAQTWRANQAVKNSTLADVNVPPHATGGSSTPATQPTDLNFTLPTETTIALKWNRNGNKPGTVFNVQTSPTGTGNWTVSKITTATKATFTGTPGTPIYFRVIAIRGQSTSAPSNMTVVWLNEEAVELFEAA
ncbi:MAG: fibronectin type III domain-containing protein [Chthonomonas sp.]|nr:fibronectin type III domain-containing protein [Chthonomonas sp.]